MDEEGKFLTSLLRAEIKADEEKDRFCDQNCVWSNHHPDCAYCDNDDEPKEAFVPVLFKTAPERIYMDIGIDPRLEDFDFAELNLNDQTFSLDNMTGFGIEYVRADFAIGKKK